MQNLLEVTPKRRVPMEHIILYKLNVQLWYVQLLVFIIPEDGNISFLDQKFVNICEMVHLLVQL